VTVGEKPLVVGLGELLWDCFPDRRRPGGAPANVAYGVQQLGGKGIICSRVGNDALGNELLDFLDSKTLSREFVAIDSQHPTGRVDIQFDEQGQPSYNFNDNNAWDNLVFSSETAALCKSAAAICFGTLAQRSTASREMIHQCLDAAGASCLKVYDVNLREPWYDRTVIEQSLHKAGVMKLNAAEVEQLGQMLAIPAGDFSSFAEVIRKQFAVEAVCITLGKEGCFLQWGEEEARKPGIKVEGGDPVGAGDAFTAGLIDASLRDWSLENIAAFANRYAALVASKSGAMPEISHEEVHTIRQEVRPL